MNGRYNEAGYWVEDTVTVTAPMPEPTQMNSLPTTEPEKEPTIEEHANMIGTAFAKIMDKALQATELAKRVAELERTCNDLEANLQGLANDLRMEREAHDETRKALQEVQTKLAQRDSAVHDLVMERDIAIGERNEAQALRDKYKAEADSAWQAARKWEEVAINADHETQVCRERANQMAEQVKALKNAFKALEVL